ncbi:hypothetical protein N8Z91_00070 [Ascidiaceihabitans sp.]|nr:hypothetical protein [Ascidiaceihabitans sp.]
MTKLSSFNYFKTRTDIIRLQVMLYVRFLRFLACKFTFSGIHPCLPFLSMKRSATAGCKVGLTVWWGWEAPTRFIYLSYDPKLA